MMKKVRSAIDAVAGDVSGAWIGNGTVSSLLAGKGGTRVVRD
jgi:acetylglutamate kinase